MPTTFYDREQAFEAKFARDEEFRFRTLARRDKLFARWAATELGLSGEAGEAMVMAVLAIPNGPVHDQALLQHVASIFSAHRGGACEDSLPAALDRCSQQARQQLIETPPDQSNAL